jgi:hypothetical protein
MFGIGNTAPRDLNSGVIATRDEEGREVNIVMQPDGSATSIGTTVSSGEEIGQANSDQIAHDQRINLQSSPSSSINPYYEEFRRLLDSGSFAEQAGNSLSGLGRSSGIGGINPSQRLHIDGEFLHIHPGFEKILKRDGHVVIDEEDWKRARELLSDRDILKIEDIYGGRYED